MMFVLIFNWCIAESVNPLYAGFMIRRFPRFVFVVILVYALMLIAVFALSVPIAYAYSYSNDVTTSAAALSDSHDTTYVHGNAFDDSAATYWKTNASGGSCTIDDVYIGQDFGVGNAYEIRRWQIQQLGTNATTSMIIEYSDGGAWTSGETIATPADGANHTYDTANYGSHRRWRLRCNANLGSKWAVTEIQMQYIIPEPTATFTNTPNVTATSTLTPTPTLSPTPNYNIEITTMAGAPIKMERSATYGDLITFGALMTLAVIGFISFGYFYWRKRVRA